MGGLSFCCRGARRRAFHAARARSTPQRSDKSHSWSLAKEPNFGSLGGSPAQRGGGVPRYESTLFRPCRLIGGSQRQNRCCDLGRRDEVQAVEVAERTSALETRAAGEGAFDDPGRATKGRCH